MWTKLPYSVPFRQWRPYWRSGQYSKCDLEFVISGQTSSSPSKSTMSYKNAWSSRIHDTEVSRFSLTKITTTRKAPFVPVVLIWYHAHSPKMNNHLLSPCLWSGYLIRHSDWLRAGRSGDRIPVGARFSAPVQTGPGAHPFSCKIGTGSFPGAKSGRGVTLTPHPPSSAVVKKE